MQIKPNESYSEWSERVRKFEYGLALQRIAEGEDPTTVIENMSRRMMNKLMHPIYKTIRDSVEPIDIEKLKQDYYENYESKNTKRADHVSDD